MIMQRIIDGIRMGFPYFNIAILRQEFISALKILKALMISK